MSSLRVKVTKQYKRLLKTKPQSWIVGGVGLLLWAAFYGAIGKFPAWLAALIAVGGAIAAAAGVLALFLRSKGEAQK